MTQAIGMDWEQRYRDCDTPWDRGEACPGLVDLLLEWRPQGRVLVPGCGFGRDAFAIASACPGCEVWGLDIAPSAVAAARHGNRHEHCRFECGDFLEPHTVPSQELRQPFDVIWEHTLFCAIDPAQRRAYAAAVQRWLKPGGSFVAVHYMTPDPERGAGPPFGVSREELAGLFTGLVSVEREWLPARSYPGREGRELMRVARRI